MTDIILASLLLFLLQLLLPSLMLGLKYLDYLLSNRETSIDIPAVPARGKRAFTNFMETYPVFLALAIIAMQQNIDVSTAAGAWVACRIAYLATYLFGIKYLRSVLWFAALFCLVNMTLPLMA